MPGLIERTSRVGVKQRTRRDCGVACLATVCAVSYEDARKALFGDRLVRSYGTWFKDLKRGALELGYATEDRLRPAGLVVDASFEPAGEIGIAMVRRVVWTAPKITFQPGRHWVVWYRSTGNGLDLVAPMMVYEPTEDIHIKWSSLRRMGFHATSWCAFTKVSS